MGDCGAGHGKEGDEGEDGRIFKGARDRKDGELEDT